MEVLVTVEIRGTHTVHVEELSLIHAIGEMHYFVKFQNKPIKDSTETEWEISAVKVCEKCDSCEAGGRGDIHFIKDESLLNGLMRLKSVIDLIEA